MSSPQDVVEDSFPADDDAVGRTGLWTKAIVRRKDEIPDLWWDITGLH